MQPLKNLPKDQVKTIQQDLITLGLLQPPVDGIPGPNTHRAWAQFKRAAKHINLDCVGTESLADLTHAVSLLDQDAKHVSKVQAEAIFGRAITTAQLKDLNDCLERFEINTPKRICHFLAQVAHETGGLRWLTELASGKAYEGRKDLGNTQSGDGVKFKGAGALQLTGRANYQAFANRIQDQNVMLGHVYLAQTYPFTSAGWFWETRKLNKLCDQGASVSEITRIINGGLNGLNDRVSYYNKAKLSLALD